MGLSILLIGLLGEYSPWLLWIKDISPELIGIGITVLIIDSVNEYIKRREEKRRLILQMGSPDQSFAIEAIRQFKENGWLYVGSLDSATLVGANPKNTNLANSEMCSVDLKGAKLTNTILTGADLRGALHVTREQLAYAIIDAHAKLPVFES